MYSSLTLDPFAAAFGNSFFLCFYPLAMFSLLTRIMWLVAFYITAIPSTSNAFLCKRPGDGSLTPSIGAYFVIGL